MRIHSRSRSLIIVVNEQGREDGGGGARDRHGRARLARRVRAARPDRRRVLRRAPAARLALAARSSTCSWAITSTSTSTSFAAFYALPCAVDRQQ